MSCFPCSTKIFLKYRLGSLFYVWEESQRKYNSLHYLLKINVLFIPGIGLSVQMHYNCGLRMLLFFSLWSFLFSYYHSVSNSKWSLAFTESHHLYLYRPASVAASSSSQSYSNLIRTEYELYRSYLLYYITSSRRVVSFTKLYSTHEIRSYFWSTLAVFRRTQCYVVLESQKLINYWNL